MSVPREDGDCNSSFAIAAGIGSVDTLERGCRHGEESASEHAEAPSSLIDAKIAALADWRGELLARIRVVIRAADPARAAPVDATALVRAAIALNDEASR